MTHDRRHELTDLDVRWVLNSLNSARAEFPDIGPLINSLTDASWASRRRYSRDILLRDVTIVLSRIHSEVAGE